MGYEVERFQPGVANYNELKGFHACRLVMSGMGYILKIRVEILRIEGIA